MLGGNCDPCCGGGVLWKCCRPTTAIRESINTVAVSITSQDYCEFDLGPNFFGNKTYVSSYFLSHLNGSYALTRAPFSNNWYGGSSFSGVAFSVMPYVDADNCCEGFDWVFGMWAYNKTVFNTQATCESLINEIIQNPGTAASQRHNYGGRVLSCSPPFVISENYSFNVRGDLWGERPPGTLYSGNSVIQVTLSVS